MTARLRAMLARTITCRRSAPSAPIRLTCAMSSAQASWFAPTVAPLIRRFSVRGQPYLGADISNLCTAVTHEHNRRHRHSALGYRTPAEYAAACTHTHTPVACEFT
jgi:hypothetical protein